MGSWKDQLAKLGASAPASSTPPTSPRPEPQYAEDSVPAESDFGPAVSGDPADYPRWALEWAVAGVELLGRERFIAALDAGTRGSGADADGFERRVQVALGNLPKARAEELQSRMRDLWLNPKGRKAGVPTFCGNATTVLDACRGGAYLAHQEAERAESEAAASLEVPQPEKGEDLDVFSSRLDAWASDKPAALLKRIGFDSWRIVSVERERREAAAKVAKERREAAERDELDAVLGRDNVEAVVAGLKELGNVSYEMRDVVMASRWGWAVFQNGLPGCSFYHAPSQPPAPEAAALLDEEFILRQASHDRGAALSSLVRNRWPLSAGQVALVEKGKDNDGSPRRFAVHSDGKVVKLYSTAFAAGVWPTTPDPRGWWNEAKTESGWCAPAVYAALKRLESARRGAVLLTPEVMEKYGRHPEKGYPRFDFTVGAGRRRSWFDLPVWRPQNGEGRLVERLDDIKLVTAHRLPVLEAAYWVDVQIGQTAKGNPRLEPCRQGQPAAPAILIFNSEGAMSNGKWGWSNDVTSAVKGSEKGGSRILWSTFVSSSGGGIHRTADLLWIARGGSIAMDSGQAVTFDGEQVVKVAGGGVDLKDDPSRE